MHPAQASGDSVRVGTTRSTTGPGAGESPARLGLLLGVLFGFAALGSSSVSVVLPETTRALALQPSGAAWVFTAFVVPFAVSTAVFGRLADVDGTRRPLLAGVVLLAAGALISALAPSFEVLVAGRVLQGVGAGAVPVLVPAVAAQRLPDAGRTVALGRVTAVMTVFAATGPLLGGAADALLGWRAAFALPALALAVVAPVAARASRRGTGRFDVLGAALTTVLATGAVLAVQARAAGPALLVACLAAVAVALPLLVLHVRRAPDGFLPVAVLRTVCVRRASLAGLTLPAAWFASLLVTPLLLSQQHGWSPLQIGALLLPGAAMGPLGGRLAGPLAHRLGVGRAAAAGIAVNCLGVVVSAGTSLTPVAAVVGIGLVTGGFSVAQPTLVDAVSGAVPAQVRGAALGIFTLVFFLGGGLGSALVGALGGPLGLEPALLVVALVPALGVLAALQVGRVATGGPRAGVRTA